MTEGAWRDPFTNDEAAAERERRRAEREARRRARQGEIGARVREAQRPTEPQAAAPQPPEPPSPAPSAPPPPQRPGPPSSVLARRRLTALIGIAALAFVVLVVVVAANKLGGDEEPAPPPQPMKTSQFVVPEGLTREQIAAEVEKAGIRGDYVGATEAFKGFDLARYDAEGADSLEGFLFPATYELPKKPTVDDLIPRQLEAFRQNFRSVNLGFADSKNLTPYDVLIIASLVEEEVQVDEERPLVASVIYNRLSDGMPLGIDATIRYATGNYTEPLTDSELAIDSPYNSRTNTGLPPTPIANPGLASMEAAAKPENTDYLFFVVKPGTCPAEHAFAETEAEFLDLQAEYNAARDAAGGQSPTC